MTQERGEAEIEEHDASLPGHGHVRGLDIAVEPPRRVQRRDAIRELRERAPEPGEIAPERGQRRSGARDIGAWSPHVLDEALPLDDLHREEAVSPADDEVIQLDEVRVDDLGQ